MIAASIAPAAFRFDAPHGDLAADLRRRAAAALSRSSHFRTRAVQCSVEGRDVVLSGAVPSWHHKQLAQQAVLGLAGAGAVRNRLVVAH